MMCQTSFVYVCLKQHFAASTASGLLDSVRLLQKASGIFDEAEHVFPKAITASSLGHLNIGDDPYRDDPTCNVSQLIMTTTLCLQHSQCSLP